jgi:hypothetical protein
MSCDLETTFLLVLSTSIKAILKKKKGEIFTKKSPKIKKTLVW